MEISVIIPAYNEEAVIGKSLESIITHTRKNFKSHEIIVIDDGSTDETLNILHTFSDKIHILKNAQNMGKGYSIKKGVMRAKGDKIIFTDADMAYPARYITEFAKALDTYDVVIGKRDIKKSAYPLHRRIMSNTLSVLNKAVFMNLPDDTQCGIKGFRNTTAKSLFDRCTVNGFGFDIEVMCIANELEKSIKEYPVHMTSFEKSKVNPITQPYKILSDIVKIKLNLITGYYTRYGIIREGVRRTT